MQERMRLFSRPFYILRIVIPSGENHKLFEATRYDELAVEQKSEVSAAEKRSFARSGNISPKGSLGLFRPIPVAKGNACARNPDLADLIGRAASQDLGIDNSHIEFRCRHAARHKLSSLALPYPVRGQHSVPLELLRLDFAGDRRRCFRPAGHKQRGFG